MSSVKIEDEKEGEHGGVNGANGVDSASSSSAAPLPDESTVTLQEIYAQMQADALQAQALAQRAGDKVDRCSYPLGPHAQPMFWCKTCHADKDVGVCLACSMTCHLEHEVEELFEKREFRCDCGNEKAGGRCQLCPDKESENRNNRYNHNFRGRYCHCDGIYDEQKDVMVQCVLCQDWFHERCMQLNNTNAHHTRTTSSDAQAQLDAASTAPTRPPSAAGMADADDEDELSEAFFCRTCLARPEYDILLPYLDRAAEEAVHRSSASATSTPALSRSISINTPTGADVAPTFTPSAAASASAASPLPSPRASSPMSVCATAGSVASSEIIALDHTRPSVSSASASTPASAAVLPVDSSMVTPSRKRKADQLLTPIAPPANNTPTGPSTPSSSTADVVCRRIMPASSVSDVSAPSAISPSSTTEPTSLPSPQPSTPSTTFDRYVNGDWMSLMCTCAACSAEYRSRGLTWLLNELLNPATSADDVGSHANGSNGHDHSSSSILRSMTSAEMNATLSPQFDPEALTERLVSRLPRGTAIDVIQSFQYYQQSIARQLKEFGERCPGVVITAEVMQTIAARAKEESREEMQRVKRARFNGDDCLPE